MRKPPSRSAKVMVTRADRIKTSAQRFLVPKRIPRGSLTLLAGYPGKGKSLYTCEVASCLTRGHFGDEPANVLFAASEDTTEHVYVPRLTAAKAVLDRVAFVDLRVEGEEELPSGSIRFPDHANDLAAIVEENDVRLLVIDPIMAHVNTKLIDAFKDEKLREHLFNPLALIAQRYDCAILGVMHLNKRSEGEALLRLSGSSGGIAGPARSVLFMFDSPDDDDERILTIAKGNYARRANTSLRFEIVEADLVLDDGSEVKVPYLELRGQATYTTDDLVGGKKTAPVTEEIIEFLKEELRNGPRYTNELMELAAKAGFSTNKDTWTRARKALGVVSYKEGFDDKRWLMRLPETMKVTVKRVRR